MAINSTVKKFLLTGFGFGVIGLVIFLYANFSIVQNAHHIYSVSEAPTSSLAIIFGGGMKNSTEMSDMQWDRVEVGAQLFKSGKVERLMITGDDGWFRADEISAMKNRLLDLGIPAEKISADPHGYRTYESCIRETQLYNIDQALVISQSFHLPRIQYLCENFGLKTTLVQADLRDYHSFWVAHGREYLARLKALLQIRVTKPAPMSLEK